MFTGLVEATGRVLELVPGDRGALIRIETSLEVARGDSLSVDGVCLTMIPCADGVLEAALSPETLERSTLGGKQPGDPLNLERALTLQTRLGGHLVQGHVDGRGKLVSKDAAGEFSVYRWSFPRESADLIIDKGSIAVDGVSLTVIEPDDETFGAALIPETLRATKLGRSQVGEEVNIELDMMAKYARHLFSRYLER